MAGTLVIDTLKASTGVLATQNGMTGIAKAWVTFAGATASISSSFNVSSITYTAAGKYAVNFTTPMPNANYAMAGSGQDSVAFMVISIYALGVLSVNSCPISATNLSTYSDNPRISVAFFA